MSTKHTPVQVTAKHVFTQEEKDEKLAQLLQSMKSKEEIEAELKTTKSTFKSRIDQKEAEIKLVTNLLNAGFEHRQVTCYLVKNFDTGKREYFEMGTDKLIQTEPLEARDYQLDLEQTEAKIAENNEKERLQEVIEDKVEEVGDEFDIFADEQTEELPVDDEISPSKEELSFDDVSATKEKNKAPEPALEASQDDDNEDDDDFDFNFGDEEEKDPNEEDDEFPFSI